MKRLSFFDRELEAISANLSQKEGSRRSKEERRFIERVWNFVDKDQADLDEFAAWLPRRVREVDQLLESSSARIAKKARRQPEPVTERDNHKRYLGCFAMRLELVRFVMKGTITADHMGRRSFAPHRRINWKSMCYE